MQVHSPSAAWVHADTGRSQCVAPSDPCGMVIPDDKCADPVDPGVLVVTDERAGTARPPWWETY